MSRIKITKRDISQRETRELIKHIEVRADRRTNARSNSMETASPYTDADKAESRIELPAIGEPLAGGFFAGRFRIDTRPDQTFALIVSPIAGEIEKSAWATSHKRLEGALSFDDGLANTEAMAAAGSPLAQALLSLAIDGFDGWYLPAQDELEILYRSFKPTTGENWLYARSGINLSAQPPTRPYTATVPGQTPALAFQAGGDQAFADAWYWSSTQHASNPEYAWCQRFGYGYQFYYLKGLKLRARAVRRVPL